MDNKKDIEDAVNKVFSSSSSNETTTTTNLSYTQQLKSKYGFTAMHNRIITNIMHQIVSWILSCFNKYSEKEFHNKMNQRFTYKDSFTGASYPVQGFDFISDWNKNHKRTMGTIIPIMKKTKMTINKYELHGLTLAAIRKHGWTIT